MQNNAVLGLILVLFVCWLFLGVRIAAFVTLGIAFSIAGAFWALNAMGSTLNVSVLLGIVIVLGMLVDDAVVVVEAMYYRYRRRVHEGRPDRRRAGVARQSRRGVLDPAVSRHQRQWEASGVIIRLPR